MVLTTEAECDACQQDCNNNQFDEAGNWKEPGIDATGLDMSRRCVLGGVQLPRPGCGLRLLASTSQMSHVERCTLRS